MIAHWIEVSPGINPRGTRVNGWIARFSKLAADRWLADNVANLRLTTPTALVARKLFNGEQLDLEELGILQGMSIARGRLGECEPLVVYGQLSESSGIKQTVEFLSGVNNFNHNYYEDMPKIPEGVTRPEAILFGTHIRRQSLSVLWDLTFEAGEKGNRFGSVRPWVLEELKVLGLVHTEGPAPDGSTGRPPIRVIANEWGKRLAWTTRAMGIELTDNDRETARRKIYYKRARGKLTKTDLLAAGYVAQGYAIPEAIISRMSEFGKRTYIPGYAETHPEEQE